MELDVKQLLLQLGVAGALLLLVAQVARLLIARWVKVEERKADEESKRTAAMTSAFAAITAHMERQTAAVAKGFMDLRIAIEQHASADVASHAQLGERVARIEGKLDAVLPWVDRDSITDSSRRRKPGESR